MRLSRKRPRRDVETRDYLRMLARMMTAASRRVAESDVEEFGQLRQLERTLDGLLEEAVRGLRQSGYTWQQIGDADGTTRQAAHKRWAARLGEVGSDQAAAGS